MVQEIYAITSNPDAIREMRENVTSYLELASTDGAMTMDCCTT
jgi:hypothetical protein